LKTGYRPELEAYFSMNFIGEKIRVAFLTWHEEEEKETAFGAEDLDREENGSRFCEAWKLEVSKYSKSNSKLHF
jgi:hypothetical protein